jgi:type IV pilus assembly protein PilV
MHPHIASHCKPSPRGFSLLEVLVAIVVLSFGVLGALGLQLGAIQSNREARLQASAVQFAREYAEMARANRVIASSASSNPYLLDITDSTTVAAPSGVDCLAASCSATNYGKWEVAQWVARVRNSTDNADGLPSPKIVTCFDSSPYDASGVPQWACTAPGPLVVKIGWTRRQTDTSQTTLEYAGSSTKPGVVLPVMMGS